MSLNEEPFTGSLGGLPDFRVQIAGANDVEKLSTFAGLPGLLACSDRGKSRIVIQCLQIGFFGQDEITVFRCPGN